MVIGFNLYSFARAAVVNNRVHSVETALLLHLQVPLARCFLNMKDHR
ncbi:MAG: hypothetical protein ACI80M_000170 [Gammaproteobacteria bacterium]|jgi:hypothetical protein|tara:strand:- start:19 stop:159 length:141 start_codon:yes stop_codon:yes gene_type:complete